MVLDTGVGIMLFDQCGNLVRKILRRLGEKMDLKDVMSVCVTVTVTSVLSQVRFDNWNFTI